METFSALLASCAGNSPVPGEFPTQRPVTRRFDVYFDLRPNKRLIKQLWDWWFETQSWSLWRHCNEQELAYTTRTHVAVLIVYFLQFLECGILDNGHQRIVIFIYIYIFQLIDPKKVCHYFLWCLLSKIYHLTAVLIISSFFFPNGSLEWRHNERDDVSVSRLFAQLFAQAQIKEHIKASRH